jgi:hypothetical protein
MEVSFERLLAQVAATAGRLTDERLGRAFTLDEAASAAAIAGELASDMTKVVAETTPPERAIACAAGCAWCCHQAVPVSAAEAAALVAHLRGRRSPDQLAALATRAGERAAKRRSLPAAERVPCVLLDGDRCSAYDARPLHCRGYNSFSIDACRDRPAGGAEPPMFTAQHLLHGASRSGLTVALAERGAPPAALELHAALAIALEVPDRGWVDAQAFERARFSESESPPR